VPTVDDPREHLEFLQGTLEVLILRSLQLAPNHAYGISQFLGQQSEVEPEKCASGGVTNLVNDYRYY
jgi:hypothetical protein